MHQNEKKQAVMVMCDSSWIMKFPTRRIKTKEEASSVIRSFLDKSLI